MNSQNYENLLKLSFRVCQDCFYKHEPQSDDNIVKIIKLNNDEEYYLLTRIAAELFLAIAEKESSKKTLAMVIEKISRNYDDQHRDAILEHSLIVINNLLENSILEIDIVK
jgi:transcriptional regulator NrdR family protein